MKKLTNIGRKKVGTPVTVKEKYDYLKKKNNNLEILRKHFDLEIDL